MSYTDISVCCPHCGKKIGFEKVFEILMEVFSMHREKLYYICQLESDYELLEYIKLYRKEYKQKMEKEASESEMDYFTKKLYLEQDIEEEIQNRFDVNYCKMSLISDEIYDKLQNIEKQLVRK